MKFVRFSALSNGRLCPPGNIPGTHLCKRLSQPQGRRAVRRIMSMKNSNDTIGNRTRDIPTCRDFVSSILITWQMQKRRDRPSIHLVLASLIYIDISHICYPKLPQLTKRNYSTCCPHHEDNAIK